MGYDCDYVENESSDGNVYLYIYGIDFGYANSKGLLIVAETKNYYLCRKKGQGYRHSLGCQSYEPPQYIIFKKNKNKTTDYDGVWSLEYSRETMAQAKKESRQKIYELEKGDEE